MKARIYLFTLLLSLSMVQLSFAQEVVVQSLNNDSCWVGPMEQGLMKMVNFSSQTQGLLNEETFDLFEDHVLSVLSTHGVDREQAKSEFLIHCNSEGLFLVHNLDLNDRRVCTWAQVDGVELTLARMGVEPVAHHGPCGGAVFAQALVTLERGVELSELMLALGHLEEKYELSSIHAQEIIKGVYRLEFGPEVITYEEKVFAALESELKQKNLVRALELNYYQHEIGDFLQLDQY